MRILLIQPPATHTIHHAQGLTFDCLACDIIGATKTSLTYTTLFRIRSKRHLYLLYPLTDKKFQVNTLIKKEMHKFKTTAQLN
jgi:hypothetical protein